MKDEELKKLAVAVVDFGRAVGGVTETVVDLDGPRLQQVLDDAKEHILELRERVRRIGKIVDIFWDRQGWYVVEVADPANISVEYPDINLAMKAVAAQGYIVREVRRTRGNIPQPKVPLPVRRPNDAE